MSARGVPQTDRDKQSRKKGRRPDPQTDRDKQSRKKGRRPERCRLQNRAFGFQNLQMLEDIQNLLEIDGQASSDIPQIISDVKRTRPRGVRAQGPTFLEKIKLWFSLGCVPTHCLFLHNVRDCSPSFFGISRSMANASCQGALQPFNVSLIPAARSLPPLCSASASPADRNVPGLHRHVCVLVLLLERIGGVCRRRDRLSPLVETLPSHAGLGKHEALHRGYDRALDAMCVCARRSRSLSLSSSSIISPLRSSPKGALRLLW